MSNPTLFPETETDNGAIFSPCRRYRYELWRSWDPKQPTVMFIGLNPSTANASTDDATIRRVIGFAKRWGFGSVYMMNLFPFVATDPADLVMDNTEVNDAHLRAVAMRCSKVVFAWGAFAVARDRAKEVIGMFPDAWCLKRCSGGEPGHPLYLRNDSELIRFVP